MKESETVKSLFNGKKYQIARIVKSMAVLNSVDGESQVLTEVDNLNLFYRKVEKEYEQ